MMLRDDEKDGADKWGAGEGGVPTRRRAPRGGPGSCSLLLLAALSHWWRFMCRARWSEREKHRSQWLHLNGLEPVCFR